MADPVDLKATGPEGDLTPPGQQPYNAAKDRENVRGELARTLVWTLVVVIGVVALVGLYTALSCLSANACSAEAHELKTAGALVTLILTPLVGLVGAVTGFYFGEKQGGTENR